MFEEIAKFERWRLRVLRWVPWPGDAAPFTSFGPPWRGWGARAPAGSRAAESNLPLGLGDFAGRVWSCAKQIMLYKHLFKLIEKLFCVGH